MKKLLVTKAEYWYTTATRIESLFRDKDWKNYMQYLENCKPTEFRAKYGEPSFTYKSGDGIVECWIFELKGVTFALFAGELRKSIIETSTPNKLEIIHSFVDTLIHNLKGEDDIKAQHKQKEVVNLK